MRVGNQVVLRIKKGEGPLDAVTSITLVKVFEGNRYQSFESIKYFLNRTDVKFIRFSILGSAEKCERIIRFKQGWIGSGMNPYSAIQIQIQVWAYKS